MFSRQWANMDNCVSATNVTVSFRPQPGSKLTCCTYPFTQTAMCIIVLGVFIENIYVVPFVLVFVGKQVRTGAEYGNKQRMLESELVVVTNRCRRQH